MEDLDMTNQVRTVLVASIIGILVIILAILVSITFQFTIVGNLVMSWILTTAFALLAFFMIDPVIRVNPVEVREKPVIRQVFVDRPVIKEIQVPMENRVIEIVDRPVIVEKEVIKEVPVEVEKPVYRIIEKSHKTLNIPKFEFIGSTQTRTYHKRTCKFSKMLKKKFKLHSHTKAFFKRKHYKACKTCLKKSKK